MKKNSGFTLVEILVVVAVMAILTGIVIASLSGSKKNSNYLKRTSDLGQMQLIITRYQISTGKYPLSKDNEWTSHAACTALSARVRPVYILNVVAATYTTALPVDIMKATDCANGPIYAYKSNGIEYKIISYNNQEDKNIVALKNPELVDPVRRATSSAPSYGYWSPGGAGW